MKAYIYKSKDGQYYFTLVARNRKVIAVSETYKAKASAYKTLSNYFTNNIIDKSFS